LRLAWHALPVFDASAHLFYGVPTLGFATMWMMLAAALTLRTTRQKPRSS
jgi:hypothetical protein